MPEILMILIIALIVFGPRKLPQVGKSIGQSLAQFRRASEDFKRQWEDEVEKETRLFDTPSTAPVEHPTYSRSVTPQIEPYSTTLEDQAAEQPAAEESAREPVSPESADVQAQGVAAKETNRDWM
jgi:TatA/E family protein of Tat protein translocase